MKSPWLRRLLRSTMLFAFALSSGCSGHTAARPDDQLGQMLASFILDSLRSGPTPERVRWIAADSGSYHALERAAQGRNIGLEPPSDSTVVCPGSTDSNRKPARGRLGYRVEVATMMSDSLGLQVTAAVSCRFVYNGERPKSFARGRTWTAAKDSSGWRLLRIVDQFVT